MNRISHWIDGKVSVSTSGRSGVVFDPATGEQQASVDFASVAEVDHAIAVAKAAFPAWRATNLSRRAEVMFHIRQEPWRRLAFGDGVAPEQLAAADVGWGVQRVALAARFFGRLPASVLEGNELPRHVRRRGQRGADMPLAVAPVSASAPQPSREKRASPFAEQCAGPVGDVCRETHGARTLEGQEQQGRRMTGQFDQPAGDKDVDSV